VGGAMVESYEPYPSGEAREGGGGGGASVHPGHLVVRASAGTGKTHRLTGRYLALLVAEASVSGLVATTFTRKAAGEVRARVLRRLADAVLDEPGEREHVARELAGFAGLDAGALPVDDAACDAALRRLTSSLDRLAVGTIDAWLGRMSGVLTWELGRETNPRVIAGDSEEAKRLRLEAVQRVIESAAEGEAAFETLIGRLRAAYTDRPSRSVVDSLGDMLGELESVIREAPEEAAWSSLPIPAEPTVEQRLACRDQLVGCVDHVPKTAKGKPNGNWAKAITKLIEAVTAGRWAEAVSTGLTASLIAAGPGGEALYYGKPIEGEVRAACEEVVGLARDALLRSIALQGRALWALGTAYVEALDAGFAAAGVMRFEDVTDRLRRHLLTLDEVGRADVLFRLDAAIEHLLIDEFQDTSLGQWSVLGDLAEEVMSDETTGRSFFVVGDPKQAIYGWRGGRVELFKRVRDLVVEGYSGREEPMDESHRSSRVVLSAVNRVFDALGRDAELGEVWGQAGEQFAEAFVEHTQAKRIAGRSMGGSVAIETSDAVAGGQGDADDEEGSEGDEIGGSLWEPGHARYVARRVGELMRRRPGRRVAVLCQRRMTMDSMVHAIRNDAGVRATGASVAIEGGQRLGDEPAVQAVLSALRLADRPDDAAAALHVAAGPMGPIVGLGDRRSAERSAARSAAAERVRRALIEQGLAETLGGWVAALRESCDVAAAEVLDRLVVWAHAQAESLDPLDPGAVVRAAASAVVETARQAEVVVMTVHASKGLEFDTVVLPDLDLKGKNRGEWLELREGDDACGRLEAVFPWVKSELRWLDDRFERAHAQWLQRRQYEALCTLYVAMTRAKRDLVVVLQPRRSRGQHKTLGGLVHAAFAEGEDRPGGEAVIFEQREADEPVADASPSVSTNRETAAAEVSWPLSKGLARGGGVTPSALDEEDDEATDSTGRRLDRLLLGSAGRHRGSMLHALLECVGWVEVLDGQPGRPTDADLAAVCRHMGLHDPADAEAWRSRVHDLIDHPAVAPWLARQSPDGQAWTDLWRERRFVVQPSGDGEPIRGTVDRVTIARDAAGRPAAARVVDYKTDRREPGQPDDAFAITLRERHAGQLHAYRHAVARLIDLPPDAVGLTIIATDGPLVVHLD